MSKRVIVIGAVALGPKAASRFKRLDPSAEVTMLDRHTYISFGGCGIPYYISAEVDSLDALRATPYGTVRTPEFFRDRKGITVRNRTEALSIDRQAHTVRVRDLQSGAEEDLPYDKLVIATGSTPKMPPVEGRDLGNVFGVTTLENARDVREACASGKVRNAVIIGGGFIGLEVCVALADMWGIHTSVVEFMPQILSGVLSPNLAAMAEHDLRSHKVDVFTSEKVLRVEGENGVARRVVTDKRTLDADLVIFATGFAPNTELAQKAGLDIDPASKAILVNEFMQTSDPDIYAGGDCVATPNLITGKPFCLALGSLANRQGRVIGTNLAADQPVATFRGAVGSWGVKLFGLSLCGTGLTEDRARAAGFDAISAGIEQMDRAHFYPEKHMMSLEVTVDRATRRVLGLQGACEAGDALKARIDAAATMLQFGQPTVDDLANAEVVYAPPFASALDTINAVANAADNVLASRMEPVSGRAFAELWEKRAENNVYFIDSRPAAAAKALAAKHPGEWHAVPLEEVDECLADIPRDRPVAAVCNTGLRSYEVNLHLRRNGIDNVISVQGGMQSLLKQGKEIR